jgi:predicted Fe-S protein YdhL (DUF1289 family)
MLTNSYINSTYKPVLSPCILICRLNSENYCIGCWRHLDEIRDWSQMNIQEQQRIMQDLEARGDKIFES